jgi:GNAT superfamily N-acetyltransferase
VIPNTVSLGVAAYQWELVPPLGGASNAAVVLAELAAFRGRVLYANGRRPAFAGDDGRYVDDDPLDVDSYHVTARAETGELVGYARLRPLPDHPRSSLAPLVGRSQFETMLEGMGFDRSHFLEASRLVADPSVRGTGVGRALILSWWALGRWLSRDCVVGVVGTRDGQSKMIGRLGGQVFEGINTFFAAEYDDDVTAMYFDLNQPPPAVSAGLVSVYELLKLREASQSGWLQP